MTLAEYLAESGLTLQAFGAKLGVAHTTVLRWASGKAAPRNRTMFEKIAAATGGRVQPTDFFTASSGAQSSSALAKSEALMRIDAADLGLDPAAIAAAALERAIGDEKARRWVTDNAAAIAAWTRHFEENETPLAAYRQF